jgi:anti-anti-sigma factor
MAQEKMADRLPGNGGPVMADLSKALNFSVTHRPEGILVSLSGQFTLPPTIDKLRTELEKIYSLHPAMVVLDFTNVTFIASLGIGFLAQANHVLRTNGGKLRVCGLKPAVMQVFKQTRMTSLLDITDTPEAAFAPH